MDGHYLPANGNLSHIPSILPLSCMGTHLLAIRCKVESYRLEINGGTCRVVTLVEAGPNGKDGRQLDLGTHVDSL